MNITLIGDIHGKYNEYHKIVSKSEYSLCLGDFGFGKTWGNLHNSNLNSSNHKVIPGNHENYDTCMNSPYCLGDYGASTLNDIEFYFIRGGISIDRAYRIGEELSGSPKTYWSQEELSFSQMLDCIEDYKTNHQNIILSHVPPASIIDFIHPNGNSILQRYKFHEGFRESTSLLGDELLKIRAPDLWVFGHHHKKFDQTINGTRFICLPELATMEIT